MLIGGVVQDEIHDHADPPTVRVAEEFVEVGQRSEPRVDVAIISHVIAEIPHRRGIDGRQPDRIHSERSGSPIPEIIQPGTDAAQIADAVVI